MYYIEKVDAPHVFPMAGPPMFLRDELFRYNGLGLENDSIFTDQARVHRAHAGRGSRTTRGTSSSPAPSSSSTAAS